MVSLDGIEKSLLVLERVETGLEYDNCLELSFAEVYFASSCRFNFW